MQTVSLTTYTLVGAEALRMTIEVAIRPGIPYFRIIGLPDRQVGEARDRVRTALKASGFGMPQGNITVNLAPSGLAKTGTGFDLGIALGVLAAGKVCKVPKMAVFGELGLDGTVRTYPALLGVLTAVHDPSIVPCMAGRAMRLVRHLPRLHVATVREAVEVIARGIEARTVDGPPQAFVARSEYGIDAVQGQDGAKRVLEIAIAGGHHMLLSGPPGTAKTLLATSMAELAPPPTPKEQQEYARIVPGDQPPDQVPFRMPQPSISLTGMLGGGHPPIAGELARSHSGILCLDELPLFTREVREHLRGPMENGYVTLQDRGYIYRYPARCMIVATQNNCACGGLGAVGKKCTCTIAELRRYARVLSQPLLDRFDLFYDVLALQDWQGKINPVTRGEMLAESIGRARDIQLRRQDGINGRVPVQFLEGVCQISKPAQNLLDQLTMRLSLTGRGRIRMLRVARTIADLVGKEKVGEDHLSEAAQYRYRQPAAIV